MPGKCKKTHRGLENFDSAGKDKKLALTSQVLAESLRNGNYKLGKVQLNQRYDLNVKQIQREGRTTLAD